MEKSKSNHKKMNLIIKNILAIHSFIWVVKFKDSMEFTVCVHMYAWVCICTSAHMRECVCVSAYKYICVVCHSSMTHIPQEG